MRVQHSLGVSRSVCSWYWGRLGLGTLALTSLVTVQVHTGASVMKAVLKQRKILLAAL